MGFFPRLAPIPVSIHFNDPGAADIVNGFEAPFTGEVVAVKAALSDVVTGNTTNYVTLIVQDGGQVGTSTATIASRGGKSISWTANQGYDLLTEGATPHAIAKGDWVNVSYAETGTVAPGEVSVSVWLSPGTQD